MLSQGDPSGNDLRGGNNITLSERPAQRSITARQAPSEVVLSQAPCAAPSAEALTNSLVFDANILAIAQDSQEVTLKDTPYILVTKVESRADPRYRCNTIVLAAFYLLPHDHQDDIPDDAEPAGNLAANLVDKDLQCPQENKPLYIPELLAIWKRIDRPLSHPSERGRLTELQATLKHIHEKTGEPRNEYAAHHTALTMGKIHLVIEFEFKPEHWGTGLAQQAISSYERAVRKLPQAAGLRTMILLPAPL